MQVLIFKMCFKLKFGNLSSFSYCDFDFQIMWLVDVFRGNVVDISEHTLTMEVGFYFSICFIWLVKKYLLNSTRFDV